MPISNWLSSIALKPSLTSLLINKIAHLQDLMEEAEKRKHTKKIRYETERKRFNQQLSLEMLVDNSLSSLCY